MKHKTAILILLLLYGAMLESFCQRMPYVSFSFSYAQIQNQPSGGLLDVKFPYSASNYKGDESSHTFDGSARNPFSKTSKFIGGSFQTGTRSHALEMYFGGNNFNEGFVMLGYGHTLNQKHPLVGCIFVKALVDFGVSIVSKKLGEINDKGQIIYAFGSTIDSTFEYNASSRSASQTYASQVIKVAYIQTDWVFLPKISIECHPFRNGVFLEFTAGWLISVAEKGRLRLEQSDLHHASSVFGHYKMASRDVKTTLDNRVISSAPFLFNGLQMGINIGFGSFLTKGNSYKTNQ